MGGVVTGSATSGAGGREVDLGRTGRAPTLRELMREDARAAFERDPSADSVSDVTRFSVGYRIVRL